MPPRKKVNPNDVTADLEDLLSPGDELEDFPDETAVNETVETGDEEMTPEEAAEIAALQAEVSKPLPEPAAPKYVPYDQLSPAQKKIRDLKDQVARRDAEIAERAPIEYDEGDGRNTITIHILEDGFTACGQVWYRGQQINFPRGGEAYEQTKDRYGNSWLDLDEPSQWRRWGKKMFGLGPWPGLQWGDTSALTDATEIADAKQAAAREARRKAAAPIIRA